MDAVREEPEDAPRPEAPAVFPVPNLAGLEFVGEVQERIASLGDLDRRVRAVAVLHELAVVAVGIGAPAPSDSLEMEMRIRVTRNRINSAETDAAAGSSIGRGASVGEQRERLQENVDGRWMAV